MTNDLVEYLRAAVESAERLSDGGTVAVNVGLLRYLLAEMEYLTAELASMDDALANATGLLAEIQDFGGCA